MRFRLWMLLCLFSVGRLDAQETAPAEKASQAKQAQPNYAVAKLYRDYCAHCHGMDGRPQTLVEIPMPEIPDFSKPEWNEYEVEDLFDSISDGTGEMPAFDKLLSKTEMEQLARLIIQLPKGQAASLIRKRWLFKQTDQKLKEELDELRLKIED